jgi:hypothetical protein
MSGAGTGVRRNDQNLLFHAFFAVSVNLKPNRWKEEIMKGILIVAVAVVTLGVAGNLCAQETIIETVANGCKTEIETYCKAVTPGEGRVLACLYAYQDKLSGKCEYALYNAAARLERAVAALTYVTSECEADLAANCAGVKAGEGRLLQCLEKNEAKVSQRCKGALKDVGLKK